MKKKFSIFGATLLVLTCFFIIICSVNNHFSFRIIQGTTRYNPDNMFQKVNMAVLRFRAYTHNPLAMNNLGIILSNKRFYAHPDVPYAIQLWQRGAANNDPHPQYLLAIAYASGLGVKQNEQKAFQLMQRSANAGFAGAQHGLGRMYLSGVGVTQNDTLGIKWLHKAATQGEHYAEYELGRLYMTGHHGVKQDAHQAYTFMNKAATQGDKQAQNALGVLYDHGLGVAKNKQKALYWYHKAAALGAKN